MRQACCPRLPDISRLFTRAKGNFVLASFRYIGLYVSNNLCDCCFVTCCLHLKPCICSGDSIHGALGGCLCLVNMVSLNGTCDKSPKSGWSLGVQPHRSGVSVTPEELQAEWRLPPVAQQTCIVLDLLFQGTEVHLLAWAQWRIHGVTTGDERIARKHHKPLELWIAKYLIDMIAQHESTLNQHDHCQAWSSGIHHCAFASLSVFPCLCPSLFLSLPSGP